MFFGLGVAYDLLGSCTQPVIEALATRMLNFLLAHNWDVVMPDGTESTTFVLRPDEELGMLQIGRHMNPALFNSPSLANSGSPLLMVPVAFDAADVRDSYFKFNLDAINLFGLIRLETDPMLLAIHQPAYQTFHNAVASHMNAHFNMIDRALNGGDTTRDAATASYLDQWLLRPRRDFYVDLNRTVSFLRELRRVLRSAADPAPREYGLLMAAQPLSACRRR